MAVSVWVYFKMAASGNPILFGHLNVGIHSAIYCYYFLATFESAKKYLWWKRHLTEAEMGLFVVSMVHFAFQALSCCEHPPTLAIIGFTFNLIFLLLFCNLYHNAHVKTRGRAERAKRDEKKTSETAAGTSLDQIAQAIRNNGVSSSLSNEIWMRNHHTGRQVSRDRALV